MTGGPLRRRRLLRSYDRHRGTPHRDAACNAPRTNLYFFADGQVAPCWLYFPAEPPRWSAERSILDIWEGPELSAVRRSLAAGRFAGRCSLCRHEIEQGNQPLAAAYDNDRPIGDRPTMLELELSNLCNLECVMCNGQLSSKIRRNREHREPLVSPYDDSFVDQVTELLPGLHELRINGGEPFLQPIVFRLLDAVAEHRPDLTVTMATNGTVLNEKVRRAMDRCRLAINVSIDSLIPERYAAIRVHGDLEVVLANFEEFRDRCAARGTDLCVMVNPLRSNWTEMADFVRFCNAQDVHLWFNTIRRPEELALWSLPAADLAEVHAQLAGERLEPTATDERRHQQANNIVNYRRLVDQVAGWLTDAEADVDRHLGVPVELRPRTDAG